MRDQALGVLVGLAAVIVTRLLDFYLPKNRMSRWAARHSVPSDEDDQPPKKEDDDA